ncbi:MAG: glycosyltransferase [Cetobacterium sp.]
MSKIFRKKEIKINQEYEPKITIIVAAHNEEKSIIKKLENINKLNYDNDKVEVIIASDNSTDRTEELVEEFITAHKLLNFKLYKVKERKGKTNAQNEAVRIATGEILFFSDANSIWDKESLREIVKNFFDESISYVCGKLSYVNSLENLTSGAENDYWNYDLSLRELESNYGSITAGNGAIYAIKKEDYIDIDLMECHDGTFPTLVALNKKRAIYEKKAIAYEKAGETSEDEYSRKVRMGRDILRAKYNNLNKYNPFKVGIYSYFYFCHRYLRYSLYILHMIFFISNLLLIKENLFYQIVFVGQIIFYSLAFLGFITKIKFKLIYYCYYYVMTIFAQLIAIKRSLLRQNKPFWEKAESTR